MLSAALMCLALNVFHESNGQPIEGQLAVAYVTYHRAGKDPKKYCKVVHEPSQFSWVGKATAPDTKSEGWKVAVAVAQSFLTFPDFSKGATHFHEVKVKPRWRKRFLVSAKIGSHIFYRRA